MGVVDRIRSFARPTPLAAVDVGLLPGRRATVTRRGPAPENPDADAAIVVGLIALAASRVRPDEWMSLRDVLTRTAVGIARSPHGPLPDELREVVTSDGRALVTVGSSMQSATGHVRIDVVATPSGLVPRRGRDSAGSGGAMALAAVATLIEFADDADTSARLALAYAVEGALNWFHESDVHAPPRDAVQFALAHRRDRIAERAGE